MIQSQPKFEIGQTVYTAQEYRLGQYVVKEIIIKIDAKGDYIEYTLTGPNERDYGNCRQAADPGH